MLPCENFCCVKHCESLIIRKFLIMWGVLHLHFLHSLLSGLQSIETCRLFEHEMHMHIFMVFGFFVAAIYVLVMFVVI